MAQLILPDLTPGKTYNIQVRAINGGEVSGWSPLFTFTTIGDTVAPAPPTSLTWVVSGTSFLGTWVAPTLNADGSTMVDFKDYQVTITASAINVVFYVTEPTFNLPFELNRSSFGTPKPSVQISVKARDTSGNLSTAVTATATNSAPAAPTGLAATGQNEAIAISWNANTTDADLDHYEVYADTSGSGFTPGPANLVFSGLATNFTLLTLTNYATRFIKVCCVDVFNQQSTFAATSATPTSSFVVDTTPPALPTGLTVTGATDPANPSGSNIIASVSWTQTSVSDLAGFTIRYRKTATTNWTLFNVYDGALRAAVIPGLSPGVAYDFQIKSFDFSGNTAGYTATSTMTAVTDTTAPANPSGVTLVASQFAVTIAWTENTETDVKNGAGAYDAVIATDSGFTLNVKTVRTSSTSATFTGLTGGTTYFARVRAVDSSGNASGYTNSTPASIAAGGPTVTDGLPPSSSPTPTVNPLYGALEIKWAAISNVDTVTYEVHVSTTTGFTPSSGTKAGEVDGTYFVVKTLPGTSTPLTYGTTYFVKLIAKDKDGAAAAGSQGSAQTLQVDNGDIAANAIHTNQIFSGSITTDKISAGAVTTDKIVVGLDSNNSILNGSFEDVDASNVARGFTNDGVVATTSTTTGVKDGARSLQFTTTLTTPASQGVFLTNAIPCTSGEVFYVAVNAQAAVTVNNAVIRCAFYNAAGTFVSNVDVVLGNLTTSNVLFEAQVTVPATATQMKPGLYVLAPSAATNTFWDNFTVRPAVTTTVITPNSITTPLINAGAVTTDKLTISAATLNLVMNSNFEDVSGGQALSWINNYSLVGTPTVGVANVISGTNSMALTVSGANGARVASMPFPVTAGDNLAVMVKLRSTVTGSSIGVRLAWGTTSGMTVSTGLIAGSGNTPTAVTVSTLSGSAATAPTTSSTTAISEFASGYAVQAANTTYLLAGQVVVPAGASWAQLVLSDTAAGSARTSYFDDVSVQRQSSAVTIIDGTITGAKINVNDFYSKTGTITNSLTIGASGLIQSSNYSAGSAGWQLSQNGLEINGGTIRAAALLLQQGENIMPTQYADFEFNQTFYTAGQFVTTNTPTITIDQTSANVKYNASALKIAAGGVGPTVDFTTGATAYNIVLDQTTANYIVSMWVLQASGGPLNANIRFKDSATSVQTSANISVPTGVYTRISAVFAANSTAAGAWVGIQLPGGFAWWVDGIQVEKQWTSLTSPSAWTPPSSTSIDGGMIKTGSIQSTSLVTTGQSSGTQPQWAINVTGGATFANLLVRGHVIVGDSSSSGLTSDQYIASANYSAGTAGYIVKGDGSAEFNNVTVRGTILANSSSSFPFAQLTGTINSTQISGNTISTGMIQANAITVDKLTIGGLTPNVVPNGDFEDSSTTYTGWTDNYEAAGAGASINRYIDTSSPTLSGAYYLTFANPGNSADGTSQASTGFPVTAGETLALSAWAKQSGGTNGGMYIRIYYGTSQNFARGSTVSTVPSAPTNLGLFNSAGTFISTPNGTSNTGFQSLCEAYTLPVVNTWYRLAGQVVVPSGATWARVAVYSWATAGGAFWQSYDRVEVQRAINGNLMVNGTIIGTTITGGTVQTAASGPRWVLTGGVSSETLTVYTGNENGTTKFPGQVYIDIAGSWPLMILEAPTYNINGAGFGGATITLEGKDTSATGGSISMTVDGSNELFYNGSKLQLDNAGLDIPNMRFGQNTVTTSESTSSASYANLTTVGPQVGNGVGGTTIIVPPSGAIKITINVQATNNTLHASSFASVLCQDITNSGATVFSPSDTQAAMITASGTSDMTSGTRTFVLGGLTVGHSILTSMQYRTSSGTGTWRNRTLIVEPCM